MHPPTARSRLLLALAVLAALAILAFSTPSCQRAMRSGQAITGGRGGDTAAFTPAGYEANALEPQLRVRIMQRTNNISLDGPREFLVTPIASIRELQILQGPIEVKLGDYAFRMTDGAGALHEFARSDEVEIKPIGVGSLTINGAEHPGSLSLRPTGEIARNRFDVIEIVSIESYVPGVIAKELYPNWSDATFEAQAIAARSYALHERARRRGRGSFFDVESTTRDQAYVGATTNPHALQAVTKTRGIVALDGSSLLRTYYSSTCGDRPAAARHTWPTGKGFEFNLASPLQEQERTCACSFSPLHRWEVRRPTHELVRRFSAFGKSQGHRVSEIQSIRAITVIERNGVGRPTRYSVTDAGGRAWRLSAEQLRLACNYQAPGLPSPHRSQRINSGDVEVSIRGGAAVIKGRGFGHGVGMCQFGAEGLARQGLRAEEILDLYYPGVQLSRNYGSSRSGS